MNLFSGEEEQKNHGYDVFWKCVFKPQDLDPDLKHLKILDPDPYMMNMDPQPW